MPETTIIKTEALTKYYGKNCGIENLNLEVQTGEVFGFLGPNGAGKTTTIRLLLDLILPTSGKATIFGYDTQRNSQKIHDRIAYIPGELEFQRNWTAGRTLNHMFKLYNHAVKWSVVEELAQHLKLDMQKKVHELSKGNKQKIGIILALVPDVDLLILDEPTSSLDPLIKNEFYKLLAEKQADSGCTVFLSSHQLQEVEKVAHRVGIINQGSLIEVATLTKLKRLALKHVEIKFASPTNAKNLPTNLKKNIKNLSAEDSTISFLCVRQNLNTVFSWLQNVPFSDVDIRNPTLEDIFLEYYQIESYENHLTNKQKEVN